MVKSTSHTHIMAQWVVHIVQTQWYGAGGREGGITRLGHGEGRGGDQLGKFKHIVILTKALGGFQFVSGHAKIL